MFSFFKRRSDNSNRDRDAEMLLAIAKKLPGDFDYIINQINEGLIRGFIKSNSPILNYNKVSYNVSVLNKYEDPVKGFFCLKGIKVFDFDIQQYTKVEIFISCDILMGYSTPEVSKFNPDSTRIKTEGFHIYRMENDDYNRALVLLNTGESDVINPNDVYEIDLNGKSYFHIKDLEDGDFIAIDNQKKVYIITHDPFEVKELDCSLTKALGSAST